MKQRYVLFFGLIALSASLCLSASPSMKTAFPLQKGINISHWLSQVVPEETDNTATYFTEQDVQFLKDSGFDHIRLPIDEIVMWHEDGTPNEDKFTALMDCINWCQDNDLRIIVDLHTVRSHHFNAVNDGTKNTLLTNPEAQAHFLQLWDQLSQRLREIPNELLAYEPLNEVVADEHEQWNQLLGKTIQQIRSVEPMRIILAGSNRWQQPGNMPHLKVPANDPNIILAFHFYSPFLVTHYQTNWNPLKDYHGSVQYPGLPYPDPLEDNAPERLQEFVGNMNEPYDKSDMLKEITPAIEKAKQTGLRLYCGEFGCYKTVPREMLLQWYADITDTLQSQNIGYAAWDYQSDFGLKPEQDGTIDQELTNILAGTENP